MLLHSTVFYPEIFEFYIGEVPDPEEKESWGDVALVICPKEEYEYIIDAEEVREDSVNGLVQEIENLGFTLDNKMEAVFGFPEISIEDIDVIKNSLERFGMTFSDEMKGDFDFFEQ